MTAPPTTARCTDAVADVVKQQADRGIDIVSDGEFGKSSWSRYVAERISGFESRPAPANRGSFARGADRVRFPEFYAEHDEGMPPAFIRVESVCTGPIRYTGRAALDADLANLKAALAKVDVAEAFLPVAAPSSAIPDRKNEYYPSDEACMQAIADALREEYRAIVDAGFILQIDDARAAVTYDRMVPPGTLGDFRRWLEMHTEALNGALAGIPEDRARYHVCWGSWPGPHVTDVPVKDIVDLVLKVKAGGYSLEMANPRHEHEWRVWETVRLPKDKLLAARRDQSRHQCCRASRAGGGADRAAGEAGRPRERHRLTDCGFAQGAMIRRTHPSIQWAKLGALVEGAKLATEQLWS